MVLYECKMCDFSSNIKTHYNRHLKTKKHIRNITKKDDKKTENVNEHKKTQKYICDYCEAEFNSLPSKKRHQNKYCKHNDSKDKLINEKNNMIKKLEKQVQRLIEKVGNTTNIQNNIQLNSYGNEDLSHLNEKLLSSLIKIPYGMIPKMIEAVHFNDKKPENKNIILPNKKDNKIMIFRNNKWIYKNKDAVINDLIDGKCFIMDTFYDDNADSLQDTTVTNYTKFKEIFSTDKDFKDNIKSECEIVMLNNR